MIILPAIDIQNGTCVRLVRGDFATSHQVAEDPLQTAVSFEKTGAHWIHMVDLDGAKTGETANASCFLEVAQNTSLKVEVGGGIRHMKTVEYYLGHGISRVILGSAAVKDPAFVKEAVRNYGEAIAVGIDARDGMVATQGWLEAEGVSYLELAKKMEDFGVKVLIFTDIAQDGTLEGVNRVQLQQLKDEVSCHIIASGGVKDIEDIQACKAMELYGVICGKSIYSGSLSLKQALEV